MRRANKEFRAALSNGRSLRIVAPSVQRAYLRACKWAEKNKLTVGNIYEIED